MSPNPETTQLTPPASRRTVLAVGTVAALISAGMGWLTWQRQQANSLDPAAADQLWTASFETPKGETLSFIERRGKPLLINFWATWCPPCVQEIPLLVDFHRRNAANGWQVVGLAIDQPSPVRRFLTEVDMPYDVGLAGLDGSELMKALGNERGGLPFSLALAADGRILMRKLGQLHSPDLDQLAKVSV